jgi:hypothetical protein
MGVDWYSEEEKPLHEWSDVAVLLDTEDIAKTVKEAREYLRERHGSRPFKIGLDIGSWSGYAGAIYNFEEVVGGPLIIPKNWKVWMREELPALKYRLTRVIMYLEKEIKLIEAIRPMARARLTVEKIGKFLQEYGLRGIVSEHKILEELEDVPPIWSELVLRKVRSMRDFVDVILTETKGGIEVSW